jgi:hypothetical protein
VSTRDNSSISLRRNAERFPISIDIGWESINTSVGGFQSKFQPACGTINKESRWENAPIIE